MVTVMVGWVMVSDGVGAVGGVGALVAAFRHDVHKLRGRSHADAEREVCGVRVNEEVRAGRMGMRRC